MEMKLSKGVSRKAACHAATNPTPSWRVLVVEDEAIARILAKTWLQELGVIVDFAESTAEVFDLMQRNAYQLVLMDIDLPNGENGFDITMELQETPAYQHVPVVGLTAHTSETVHRRALDVGMLACYRKPLSRELVEKISKTYLFDSHDQHAWEKKLPLKNLFVSALDKASI